MSYEPPRKPEQVDRLGKMSVSTWSNPVERNGKQTDRPSFSIQKRYLDRDTQTFQTAQTYFLDDMPVLIILLCTVLIRHLLGLSATNTNADAETPDAASDA